jgi:Tfp pilus assembly protein PilF
MAGGTGVTEPAGTKAASREQIEAELLDRARFAYSLQQQGDFTGAETIYREILLVDPDHFHATHLLGVIGAQTGHFAAAAELIARAIAIDPDDAAAHSNLGNVLWELDRFDDALACQERAIALDPNYAAAHSNRSNVLKMSCEQALALVPDYADAWANRGALLQELGRFDDAIASYDRAIALNPHFLDPRLNKAQLALLRGDFEQGWRDYELRRFKPGPIDLPSFEGPQWTGAEDLNGRTILLHFEQGLGDMIQFCRYIRKLNERGARVLFAPWPQLVGLMRSLDASCEIVDLGEGSPAFDFHCPLMSLSLAFGTVLATIPRAPAYLAAEPARAARWADRIGADGFRIGICWQGRSGKVDLGRSFPLAQLAGIARLPDVRLISLHKGSGEGQLGELPAGMAVEQLGEDFDVGPQAFLDTAAVIDRCDLVISSDTSIAHLAGALGKTCWIALKHVPDWRWLMDRRDSPWYPSVTLFRQPMPGDWPGVFTAMEGELRSLLATGTPRSGR